MTTAVWLAVTTPATALKLAVLAVAGTVTETGTVNNELLSDKLTEAPPLGAASERVTVQTDVDPDETVVGEHCNAVIVGFDAPIVNAAFPEVPPPGVGLNTVTWAVAAVAMSAAVIAAFTCVALTNVVVRFDPFHLTTAPLTNPVPFTVKVNAAPPAVALVGDNELIVGTGFEAVIVKAAFPEVPPPGVGLNTDTCAVPAVAISAAVIAACNCVVLTNVVVRFDPFQFTTAPLTNPAPFTVSVNAAPPAIALAGESELIVGTGFVAVIVNAAFPEVPPPGVGLNTVTWAISAVSTSTAVMEACNCVALTNVVVRFDPFHLTVDPATNPVPFTVKVKAGAPARMFAGESELIVGTGFEAVIVNAAFPEVPPPGVGLNTDTCAVPALAMSAAVIAAFICVALTNVVVRFDPFHLTTEPLTNPVPFTVSVNAAPPAVALAGDSKLTVGTGFDCVTVIVPPAPETLSDVPSAAAPIVLLIAIESRVLLLAALRFAVTTATTPLLMAFAFIPLARQITDPVPALQLRVLPALVRADPAAVLSELMSLGENESVHCKPAGVLVPAFKDRFSERAPPLSAVPEAKLKEGCA